MANQELVFGCHQEHGKRRPAPAFPDLVLQFVSETKYFRQAHAIDFAYFRDILRIRRTGRGQNHAG
jgi:hypothetical protein